MFFKVYFEQRTQSTAMLKRKVSGIIVGGNKTVNFSSKFMLLTTPDVIHLAPQKGNGILCPTQL